MDTNSQLEPQAAMVSDQPDYLPCIWPIWRVHPKKLTGECGWNYMKERYPVPKHILSTTFPLFFGLNKYLHGN